MIARIATDPVITASPAASAADIAALMRTHHVGCVVIVEDERPIGIVTDRDLALRVVADSLPGATPATDVMTPDPVTALASAGIETMLRALRKAGTRRLPLVDERGRLVAIVTHDDLVQLLASELKNLGESIERAVDSTELR
jgi:CBS domain-containing protein